jgi:exosortase
MTFSKRLLYFGLYCVGVALTNVPALRTVAMLSLNDDMASSHLILIPLVTAALIYQERRTIFSSVEFAPRAGLGLIAAGLILSATARLLWPSGAVDSLTWAVVPLVVMWIGGFLLFFGPVASRSALFPLLFLVFMIPIPAVVLDKAVQFLKVGSTEVVALLFQLTGTPHFREGFVFALPNVSIEVADQCSGIRSSIALLLTTLLAGHMFLQRGWSKAVVVLAVLPVAMLKNGIRIVGLTLLALHVDPGFLTGQLHHEGGIVFFMMSLLLLVPLFAVLRRSETRAIGYAK